MIEGLLVLALALLATIALSLWRVHRGPSRADRMMGAQLIGTSGVALVLLLAGATGDASKLDVAIVLALLAAFASLAFAKTASRDAAGDPEEADPQLPARGPGHER